MEAAEPFGVAVGLVASVDDRAFKSRFEPHYFFEELGTLAQLEEGVRLKTVSGFGAHFAGPHDDLARNEVRNHGANDAGELDVAADQVVFVRPVGVALAVGVVLVEGDGAFGLERFVRNGQRAAHDLLARGVVQGGLARSTALG